MNEHVKYLYYYFLMSDRDIGRCVGYWDYIDRYRLSIWWEPNKIYLDAVVKLLREWE